MDRRVDLALSVGILAFGIFLFVAARNIALGQIDDPVGPRGVPTFIALLFIGGGIFLTVRRLLRWGSEDSHFVESDGMEDEPEHPASARRAFAIVGVSILYAAVLPFLGFPLATPPLLFALMWILEVRSVRLLGIVSIVYTLVVFSVFTYGLSVDLPTGILSEPLDAVEFGR